jgi:hypothetical protein
MPSFGSVHLNASSITWTANQIRTSKASGGRFERGKPDVYSCGQSGREERTCKTGMFRYLSPGFIKEAILQIIQHTN